MVEAAGLQAGEDGGDGDGLGDTGRGGIRQSNCR